LGLASLGLASLGLAALLVACGGEPSPRPPARIVALAPSAVEMLFALGLGERVVGVGDHSTFPPEAASRPRLGSLFDPNLERIVALAPDLAVLLSSQRELAGRLTRLSVPVLIVESDTLRQTEEAIAAIARRCGVPEAGERLLAELRAGLAPLEPPARPAAPGPRVLLSLERQPGRLAEVLSAGPGSFYDELLVRLGAANVLADAGSAFPRVSLETALARQPEVIVEVQLGPLAPAAAARLAEDWRGFPEIPAVAAGRVEVVAGDHALIPGPRLPLLYQELRRAIHAR
jgi:iron complex transport system substrate-binding protein